MSRWFPVCPASELPVGARRLVDVPGIGQVGVFNVDGEYRALKSACPHQGAPLCQGKVTGTSEATFTPGELPGIRWTREGGIIRCPWHGWEFDIRTGKALCGERWRVATYDVEVGPPPAGTPVPSGPPPPGTSVPTFPVTETEEGVLCLVLAR